MLINTIIIMSSIKKPEKAYKNLEFLNSANARTVRILSEFYEPQARFKKYNVVDTCVFFGSARLVSSKAAKRKLNDFHNSSDPNSRGYKKELKRLTSLLEMSRYYDDAVILSRKLTEWSISLDSERKRFIICSGGGPGIMEAANKGAKQAGGSSIGLNISIPYEQFVNKYVDPNLAFEFHYFFMRKFWFLYLAKALIVFPGGFGTMDELMEVVTLLQTGKVKKKIKIIVYDEKFWKRIINFEALIESGVISENDLKYLTFSNSIDHAFEEIKSHFEKHFIRNGYK